jgi:predicted acyl esterase
MIEDGFEIRYLPGVPPEEGGCPPPAPRTEHADGMVIEYDTAVAMRDGVEIFIDVFRPDSDEPVAPIIAWGPYGKHGAVRYELFPNHGVDPSWTSRHTRFEAPDPLYWTRHGYAVVNVDPRGMWNSHGNATFYSAQEARDVYDLIEWAAARPWSNGRVGMSGVSYLAITQWRAAADRPPHLAAINPWEGVSDRYRDMAYHGGIPEDSFGPMWRSRRVPYSTGMVEDTVAMYADHPLFDEYWEGKTPELSKVEIPAFVVASWSDQGLHTRGTLEGFKRISSPDRWLLVHGRKKWQFYYRPDNVELLRQFFDKFLRGVDSGVDSWPRVRLEVRERFDVGHQRDQSDWPLPQSEPRPLYLDPSSGHLVDAAPTIEATVGYAAGGNEHAEFTHRFDATTDLVGPMNLHLWVEAEGSDDMDLFVAIQKLDADGEIVPFSFLNSLEDGPVALGWLRASHRALDPERSTPLQPWHPHRREERLAAGEIVPVDVEIWPSGTRFLAGEQMRVIIQGSDIYTYPPGVVRMGHSKTRNAGMHIIHAGGAYDSHLLIPVIPADDGEPRP